MNIILRIILFLPNLFFAMMKSFTKSLQDLGTKVVFGKEPKVTKTNFYDLVDKDMAGKVVPMSNFKGSVLLVTNVASFWGLTKQNYTELNALMDELGPRGLKVLAFPCNQFAKQEPKSHDEILKFVEKFGCREKLTFFKKGHVNGSKTREIFGFLKNALPSSDGTKDIRWNFAKFLVDHNGQPFKRYGSKTSPFTFKDDIEELLQKKEKSS
jgi:glutathione peroxidase